jgi:hypothetical protein
MASNFGTFPGPLSSMILKPETLRLHLGLFAGTPEGWNIANIIGKTIKAHLLADCVV